MSEELDILKLVAKRLDQKGISYMLTGSIATNFYSVPRMTRDIDIIVELDRQKVAEIFEAFKDEFYLDKEAIARAVKQEGMFNVIHNEKLVKVDFIIRKESEYRKLEFGRRRTVSIAGVQFSLVSPEDLVISKLFWAKDNHSEFQLNDVRNILEDVVEIDRDYLEKWIDRLGLKELYKEVK